MYVSENDSFLVSIIEPRDVMPASKKFYRRRNTDEGITYDFVEEDHLPDDLRQFVCLFRYGYVGDLNYRLGPVNTGHIGVRDLRRRYGCRIPRFIIRYFGNVDVADDVIPKMMVDAQVVGKAIFADGTDARSRRLQIFAELFTEKDAQDSFLKRVADPASGRMYNIAQVLARLCNQGSFRVNLHLFRALVAGAVDHGRILGLLYDVSLVPCALCTLCSGSRYKGVFRIGSDSYRGTFIIGSSDLNHVNNFESWDEVQKKHSGLLLDVGHPVFLCARERWQSLERDRVLRWSHRIFRAYRFGIHTEQALDVEFDVSLDMMVLLSRRMTLEMNQKATIWICLFLKQYLVGNFEDFVARLDIDRNLANGMCENLDEFSRVATARYYVYRSAFPIDESLSKGIML